MKGSSHAVANRPNTHAHNTQVIAIAAAVAAMIVTSVVARDAAAQGYHTTQLAPGQVVEPAASYYSVRGDRFRLSREQPVVGRTVFGGGWSFGAVEGAGINAEGALSFRLESDHTYGGSNRFYLIPEIGFAYINHAVPVATESEPTQTSERRSTTETRWEDQHHLAFGMAGMRVAWGNTEAADVYVLGRLLAGSHDSQQLAFGTMAGLGVELYHGIFALEAAHIWTYSEEMGHVQGIRFSANLDVIRAASMLCYLFLNSGMLAQG